MVITLKRKCTIDREDVYFERFQVNLFRKSWRALVATHLQKHITCSYKQWLTKFIQQSALPPLLLLFSKQPIQAPLRLISLPSSIRNRVDKIAIVDSVQLGNHLARSDIFKTMAPTFKSDHFKTVVIQRQRLISIEHLVIHV